MAKRKRRQKITTPDLQPQASQQRRALWVFGIASIIVLVFAVVLWQQYRQPLRSQSQVTIRDSPPAVAQPSETPQQTPSQKSNIRRGSQGYVRWQTQETELADGKKQIQGTIYWNDKTGANNEPVVGMPLHLATADHEKKELVVLANSVTDENGQFALIVPTTGDIRLGCDFAMARNIPQKVILEQGSKNRSVEEDRLLKKVIDVERRVNAETAWGQKVNRWIDEQQTAIYVDYSGPASGWYDSKNDRIVFNPQKTLPREQLLEELKKGYLHTFMLRFHEELHRAQNQRSGKTQANPEMALLQEIHAYWLSHLSSVDQLYEYIYKNPHGAYKNLHWVNLEQFGRLCAMVDWLYVYFNEDFDKLAEYVGNAESVAEFMQETQTLIDSTVTDRDVFVQRADKMWREKREWQETTAQLAQEILGR